MRQIDLSDYAKPDKPLRCHYCNGHGSGPRGSECPMCIGTGDLLCLLIGRPGCLGYAAYSAKEPGHDDLCQYHFTHHDCGDKFLIIDGEFLCPTCDPEALRSIPTDRLVEAARKSA